MEKEYPKDSLEFERMFRTERDCRDYLVRIRWLGGFRCPRCGHTQAWRRSRGLFQCGGCHKDTSVTQGTIFHGSHLPLRIWFRAMWCVTSQKSGVSALGLQRALGIGSYETAWACLHKLRRAMVRPGRELLGSEVEVDETFIGGHEAGAGHRHIGKKSLVAIAVEVRGTGMGRVRLRQIPDASEKSLVNFVRDTVAPASTVVTDGWSPYSRLVEWGYIHRPRPASPNRAQAITLLPRVHRVAALLKRWLLGIHQGSVSKRLLGAYLDEFAFRFNRRLSQDRGWLFHRLAQQALAIGPVSCSKPVKLEIT